MKTLVFENNGLFTEKTLNWLKSLDENFIEINSETREYDRSDDLFFFGLLIDKDLTDVAVSSTFTMPMSYQAYKSFGKKFDDVEFTQLDYFSWIIYEAISFRKKFKMNPLTIHINYNNSIGFIEMLNYESFGIDTKRYMNLMFRQFEGEVKINIYKDYQFINQILTEKDLKQ